MRMLGIELRSFTRIAMLLNAEPSLLGSATLGFYTLATHLLSYTVGITYLPCKIF